MFTEWDDELENKLREIYQNSKPSEESPSKHTGLKAVYDYLLVNNSVLDEAMSIIEYALSIRTYGEKAPGGNETWTEWDKRTESFLRVIRKVQFKN